MKILISGGGGFIGSVLKKELPKYGHNVSALVRRNPFNESEFYFNPKKKIIENCSFENFDCIINLSGETIFGVWTKRKRKRILLSRIETTRFLVDEILKTVKKPIFISTSAIGYYGFEGNDLKDENCEKGSGFLSDVCKEWENEALRLLGYTRVVIMRFGVVIGREGGMLKMVMPLYKFGFGAKIGGGKQPFSFVAIEEIPHIVDFILKNNSLSGPINVTSPQIIQFNDFHKALQEVYDTFSFVWLPKFILQLFLGDMAKELLLGGVKAYPQKLITFGYKFRYPNLKEYLNSIV